MAEWGHVHHLGLDGRDLFIGTHDGLWRQRPGEAPSALSPVVFDVMGLVRDGDRWLASGHPGVGMDAPSDLGLLESRDGGQTWTSVSLSGEVDFHRIVASGDTIMGIDSGDGSLLRSNDDGATWESLGTPPLFDLTIDPAAGLTVIGTTADGVVRSTDGGRSFSMVAGAPLLALLAWTPTRLFGAAVDGAVFTSTDEGLTWTQVGALPEQPIALVASSEAVVAFVGESMMESVDGGSTFTVRKQD